MTTVIKCSAGGLRIIAVMALAIVGAAVATAAESILLTEAAPSLSGRLTVGDGWPDDSAILLLHGTLSHSDTEIIQSLEALFSENGRSTLAINLSLGVDGRDTALYCDGTHRHRELDALDELQRWANWLVDQGVSDITLLGHSRGANQMARFARERSNTAVKRMILVAPPRWSRDAMYRGYAERYDAPLDAILAQAQQQVAEGRGNELLPNPVGFLYCGNTRATAEAFMSYYRDDPLRDTPTLLSEVELPTLVVTGSEDTIVEELPAALADTAPNAEIVEIDGADHFFRDLYADELVDLALEFIDETP